MSPGAKRPHNTLVLAKQETVAKPWGPEKATHFWGEPEQGYFHASDPWVIRRDMQMLANATRCQVHDLAEHFEASYYTVHLWTLIALSLGCLGENERTYLGPDLENVGL